MQAKNMDDAAASKQIDQYFKRTWEHFDVNKENILDVSDMPAFMKYLASDQSIDLDSLKIWVTTEFAPSKEMAFYLFVC